MNVNSAFGGGGEPHVHHHKEGGGGGGHVHRAGGAGGADGGAGADLDLNGGGGAVKPAICDDSVNDRYGVGKHFVRGVRDVGAAIVSEAEELLDPLLGGITQGVGQGLKALLCGIENGFSDFGSDFDSATDIAKHGRNDKDQGPEPTRAFNFHLHPRRTPHPDEISVLQAQEYNESLVESCFESSNLNLYAHTSPSDL
ncbi:hypothetical protein AVEN_40806-1 [Araneus ventricosus]|uniref:Uncharacterized protein n=1 Tax=Araneus ventricosus TaxID=182803 RepID=A0A4Y2CE86_ARAVE|nr:hypothetical protein AVEN_40806-1 [Araneus ventricosus]